MLRNGLEVNLHAEGETTSEVEITGIDALNEDGWSCSDLGVVAIHCLTAFRSFQTDYTMERPGCQCLSESAVDEYAAICYIVPG